MRRVALTINLIAWTVIAASSGHALAQQQGGEAPQWLQNATAKAQAQLKDKQGKDVGTVTFGQFPGAVAIRGQIRGLERGWHAIHVHQTGSCQPDFNAAGGHFSAGETKHGLDEAQSHPGDLPNIYVGEDGSARFEMITSRFSLGAQGTASGTADRAPQTSGQNVGTAVRSGTTSPITISSGVAPSIFDDDGSAIVIHAQPDDYRTDPSGDSGDRLACGVITRS